MKGWYNMKKGFTLIELLVCAAIVGVLVGIVITVFRVGDRNKVAGIMSVRLEAVKAGVAEWVVTNEMGDVEFRWVLPKSSVQKVTPCPIPPVTMCPEFYTNRLATNDCFLIRLKDERTGKDVDLLIPVYTNPVLLQFSSTVIPLSAR